MNTWAYLLSYLFGREDDESEDYSHFSQRAILHVDQLAWLDCPLIWSWEGLSSPEACYSRDGENQFPAPHLLELTPSAPTERIGPDWLHEPPDNPALKSRTWWPRRLTQWSGAPSQEPIRQMGGLFSNQLMAGVDGGRHVIEQKGGLLSDSQVATLHDGQHWVVQSGGWGDDEQTVVVEHGHSEILQEGGRGIDHQMVELRGGQHQVRQVGGRGDDRQRVVVRGTTDAHIVLEGGEGSDHQEVILRGTGCNRVEIDGGQGADELRVRGGQGQDQIRMRGGAGDDLFVYRVGSGQASVRIEGGGDRDRVVIYLQGQAASIRDSAGQLLFEDAGEFGRPIQTNIQLYEIERCRVVWRDFRHLDL